MCDGFCCLPTIKEVITAKLEAAMFLAMKVHLVSGMVIGALAVTAAQKMCKQMKAHKQSSMPANPPKK